MKIEYVTGAPGPGGATSDLPGDSGDVASIEAFVRGLVESLDVEALTASYAADALVVGEYTPGLFIGTEQIRGYFGEQRGDVVSRTIDDIDLNVCTNGNLGTAHGQQRVTSTTRDGTATTHTTRFHVVVRKAGNGWVVLAEHTSFCADFATGGAWEGPFIKPGLLRWDQVPFPAEAIDAESARHELNLWQIDDVRAQVAEQAMHYYGPGDYTTIYDSRYPSGRMVGMWDTFVVWNAQMDLKHVDETLTEFRVWTDGQFAAHFTLGGIEADRLDGGHDSFQIRQIDCLHRVDGLWYSFVESVSFPVDQHTGMLAVNLPEERKSLQR